jgi:hypothetical protein
MPKKRKISPEVKNAPEYSAWELAAAKVALEYKPKKRTKPSRYVRECLEESVRLGIKMQEPTQAGFGVFFMVLNHPPCGLMMRIISGILGQRGFFK